jgi:hypothetical protein
MHSFFRQQLHVCNASEFPLKQDVFYPLKHSLLQRFATPDGWQKQIITHNCYGCGGNGNVMYRFPSEYEDCDRCCGSGIWSQSKYYLQRWNLNGHIYYTPSEPYKLVGSEREEIYGKIRHSALKALKPMRSLGWLLIRYNRRAFINYFLVPQFITIKWKMLRFLSDIERNSERITNKIPF